MAVQHLTIPGICLSVGGLQMTWLIAWLCIFILVISVKSQLDYLRQPIETKVCIIPISGTRSDFSGFRVQIQSLAMYQYYHTRISYCQLGRPDYDDAYFPTTDKVIPWGQKICSVDTSTSSTKRKTPRCFMMARRQQYVYGSEHRIVIPTLWIGGLYECPGVADDDGIECTSDNAIPIGPLMADDNRHGWIELPDARHYVQRMPVLYTYDFNAPYGDEEYYLPGRARGKKAPPLNAPPETWFRYVDVNENYTNNEVEFDFPGNDQKSVIDGKKPPSYINPPLDTGDGKPRRPVFPVVNGTAVMDDPQL
jgi:hypothetical protein